MGFIKHALIGIALYEVAKYCLREQGQRFDVAVEGPQAVQADRQQPLRADNVDIVAGARQTDSLERMKEREAVVGSDPETPLAGGDPGRAEGDPWKNSLANDDLRAPDS